MVRLIVLALTVAALVAPASSNAADKIPIRVGIDVGVNSLPFWVGSEQGFFAKNGLEISERTYDSGFLGLLAIGANDGDTSSQSDAPTLTLTGKGIDAEIVAVMARSADNYKIVGKKDITNGQQLKGKKFGFTFGSACEYVGLKYLAKFGLKRDDVQVVGADPAELAPLLAKGDIDAACFWEPWGRKTVALSPDSLHIVGTGRDIYAVNMYLTVRRAFATAHPEAVKGLLQSLKEADAYIAAHPDDAVRIIEQKHRVNSTLAQELEKDFDYKLVLDQEALTTMKQVGDWLIENKKVAKLPEWDKLIAANYLREVAPESVTINP